MKKKPKIIAIAGPSATGKTELAVKTAKEFNGEIISADSRYVYKYLDIASAKPTEEEKCGIPHYLTDIAEVDTDYSAGQFLKDADFFIKDITSRGKIPIVTGGTGLYFRSLNGVFDIPEVPADKDFRQKTETIPTEELYSELLSKNPAMAAKIHPNNKVKIVRALEITNAGAKLTSKECPYDILMLGLNCENRQFLYEKCEKRVDKMLEAGLLQEADFLFKKYGFENNILNNTIGIKELKEVLQNSKPLDEAISEIKKNTRHYIKRQISWFNTEKDLKWFYIDTNKNFQSDIFETIKEFLKN